MDSKSLKDLTFVDTPGVLAKPGNRGYDFLKPVGWFADRADFIVVLFDPHKLDISEEMVAVISTISQHGSKIRLVLNKADSVSAKQLMGVNRALMWHLGKQLNTPECESLILCCDFTAHF